MKPGRPSTVPAARTGLSGPRSLRGVGRLHMLDSAGGDDGKWSALKSVVAGIRWRNRLRF